MNNTLCFFVRMLDFQLSESCRFVKSISDFCRINETSETEKERERERENEMYWGTSNVVHGQI